MTVSSATVTVSTSATLLHSGGGHVNRPEVVRIKTLATDAATVFIGSSGVNTTDGFPHEAAAEDFECTVVNEDIYGIVASSTEDVQVSVV